jgi:hypothetical protein
MNELLSKYNDYIDNSMNQHYIMILDAYFETIKEILGANYPKNIIVDNEKKYFPEFKSTVDLEDKIKLSEKYKDERKDIEEECNDSMDRLLKLTDEHIDHIRAKFTEFQKRAENSLTPNEYKISNG